MGGRSVKKPAGGLGSTLLGSRREERRPLLFDLRATTVGALDLALLMFGKSQNCGEFLATRCTEIFVLGHGTLPDSQIFH
jgi:hypothetical protein